MFSLVGDLYFVLHKSSSDVQFGSSSAGAYFCRFVLISLALTFFLSAQNNKISSAKEYLPLPSSSHQRSSSVQIKQLRQAGWLNKMKNTMQSKKRFFISTMVIVVLVLLLWVFVPNQAYQPFNSNKDSDYNIDNNGKLEYLCF